MGVLLVRKKVFYSPNGCFFGHPLGHNSLFEFLEIVFVFIIELVVVRAFFLHVGI